MIAITEYVQWYVRMMHKILIAFGLLVIILIAAGVYIFRRIDSQLAQHSQEQLKKLQPLVVTGDGLLKKSTFYEGDGLGEVTEILLGWPAGREGASLTVVGNRGAQFLDRSGVLKKQVAFSRAFGCPVKITKLNPAGEYGFLTRDESWAVDVTLLDEQGQVRWTYPGSIREAIDDSVGSDIDGKGQFRVVIGFNGGGGVALVDDAGKKIWQRADTNVWHVETLDINGDGRKVILHSNAKGQLLVQDMGGEVISHYVPEYYVSDFALTRWGEESEPNHILVPSKTSSDECCKPVILVLDAGGRTIIRLDAPLGDLMHMTQGTPVHFSKEAPHYAVLQTNGPLDRSILLLYDARGKIAYQEVMAEACFSIASMPEETGDRLLIGCSGKILEYSPVLGGHPPQARN